MKTAIADLKSNNVTKKEGIITTANFWATSLFSLIIGSSIITIIYELFLSPTNPFIIFPSIVLVVSGWIYIVLASIYYQNLH